MCFLVQGHTPRHVRHWKPYFPGHDHFLYPTAVFSLLQVHIKNTFTVNKSQVAKINVFTESHIKFRTIIAII